MASGSVTRQNGAQVAAGEYQKFRADCDFYCALPDHIQPAFPRQCKITKEDTIVHSNNSKLMEKKLARL